ncbi:MAG: two-component regulator propeller domain-containing protein [Bacteroidota bacterium]
MKKIFFLSLVLIFQLAFKAQQSLRFHRLNVNNGLSQNTVISIVQDHNGFIWMATQDGLNRYDGYTFKVYRHTGNDPTTLSNNYVMNLAVDKSGNVWAGTTNGLNRIDGKTGRLTRIDLSGVLKNASNYRIHAIAVGENGFVYFGMSWGIFCIDASGTISMVSATGNEVPGVQMMVQKNKLWICTGTKIICYDYILNKVDETAVSINNGLSLLNVQGDSVLYKTQERLFSLVDGKTTEVYSQYFNTPGIERKTVTVFKDGGDDWICTENGLIWQRGDDTLLIKHNEEYEFSLSSDYVYCVYKDRSGLYWIGTSRGGVCVFNPRWQAFKIISKPLGLRVAVWSIAEKGDTLILATAKGIKAYRKKRNVSRITALFLPEQALTEIELPGLQEHVKDFLISSVSVDAGSNLWIGTENNGVYYYDFNKKHLKVFLHSESDSTSLVSNSVLHLDTLSATRIGVSSPLGFSEIDIPTFKVTQFFLTRLHKNVSNNYTLKAWPESNKIWFSSACGLCVLDRKNGSVRQLLPDEKNVAEQYHNIVSDVKKDSRNRYWVATLGYGLLNLDPATGKFKRFGLAEGLKNETVLGILPDDKHHLWLGTNEGIAKFDTEAGTFENFDAHEGLESKECTKNGFYKSGNGDLFFGTMSGLLVFDPDAVREDTSSLKTILTAIKINYVTVEDSSEFVSGSNFSPRSLNLDHTVKTISFEFAALHFLGAENVQYKYRLDGFSDAWVTVTSAGRNAIYTNLPPGRYTFNLIPLLHGKEMAAGGLSFTIIMKPPFWLTWWFLLSVVICGILLVTFTVRYLSQRKLKNKLKQVEAEQKLQKEKERISRELHDNVGSQLTYIIKSLDNLSYKSGHDDKQMVRHLDALGEFSRDTLSQLRESIWAINSKAISVSELIAKIHEYTNKINDSFEKTQIKVTGIYEVDTPLTPTIAINSFRILQETITNSLKYAEASCIEIIIQQQGNQALEFIVSDNGKGFEPGNLKRKGYGLENIRSRAAEIGTELKLNSAPGKGTRICFLVETQ